MRLISRKAVMKSICLLLLVPALALAGCSGKGGIPTPAASTITVPATGATTLAPEPPPADTPNPTATHTPLPPALPVFASPVLIQMTFPDENNGWGIAANGSGAVLRSIDGGQTWLDATPPDAGSIGYSARLSVLNASTIWLLVPAADFFTGTLFRTSDGGATWDSNAVPFGEGTLQFLDANTGRALAARDARGGTEAVELLQTSDGGRTWQRVFYNDASQPGSSNSLPLAGIKNGMKFIDPDTGWVTGSSPDAGKMYFYVTHDSGVSWSEQSLPLPATDPGYRYLPSAPVFFGDDGWLPLIVDKPGQAELTFFTSHDGGQTWSGDANDSRREIKPGLVAFADARNGWSWDGGDSLYLTTDGGQSWESQAPNLDLRGNLVKLEFVPAGAGGFIGWALTRVDDAGHSQLYRTDDGSTWRPLIP